MTTQTTLKNTLHEVNEIKILKAQIIGCKNAIENTFGKTNEATDQDRATLVVLTDHFTERQARIMGFMKTASNEDKAQVFKSMKEA